MAVLARVAGFADPVAVYRVGDRPGHDGFVLHIPYALQRDGRTPSARTPAPGAAASLFVVTSDGREISAGSIAAPASGEAVAFDAEVRGDDLSPAPAAEPQLQGCGAGSGMCGSTGLITLALMFASLAQMKSRRRDIRRR